MSDDHDLGLARDLPLLVNRRRALAVLGGAGLSALLAACGGSGSAATSTSTGAIPEETAGPFPGDGSNGVNALTERGVVRSDITHSFGSASGAADGVPLAVRLRIVDGGDGTSPKEGVAVYLWHCDAEGRYSLYDQSIADENYLRGVQAADADGRVTFTSIYPAAYSGRWPHIHFEIYPSLDDATSAQGLLHTSQLALPEDVSRNVYATDGYPDSLDNLSQTSLATDMVFSDGSSLQLADVTGSVDSGYTAILNIGV